jgi:hypothetical protein
MSNLDNNTPQYSFTLRPEDHQPSGVCDFSRIYGTLEVTFYDENGKIMQVIKPNQEKVTKNEKKLK